VDLDEGRVPVEPVEGLGDGDRVDGSIRERDPLRRAREHPRLGQRLGQLVAHGGNRLDRDEPGSCRRQGAGQLAGACGEVENRPVGRVVEHPRQESDRRRRVGRPAAFVFVGGAREPARRGLVHAGRRLGHGRAA
jgi:hypothetical protein